MEELREDGLLEAYARDAGAGVPEVEAVDEILSLLPDFDYPAQLTAIRELLRRQRDANAETTRSISALEAGPPSQQAADERVDLLHGSVYQDAAHSAAAVGMLAPLAESFFRNALVALGKRHAQLGLPLPSAPRFTKPGAWDPKRKGGRGIVTEVREICAGAGITPYLPPDTHLHLEATVAYRNAMFHNGFEWPPKERADFRERAAGWPSEWFAWSETAGEPWIAYMSDEFIDAVLATLEGAMEALGQFARDMALKQAAARAG